MTPNNESTVDFKLKLHLPTSASEWESTIEFFGQLLVLAVLSQSSADGKHAVLLEGIYDYFVGECAVRAATKRHVRD